MKDVELGVMVLDLVTRVKEHGRISEEAWRRIDRFEPDTDKALEELGRRMAPAYEYIGRMTRQILQEATTDRETVAQ